MRQVAIQTVGKNSGNRVRNPIARDIGKTVSKGADEWRCEGLRDRGNCCYIGNSQGTGRRWICEFDITGNGESVGRLVTGRSIPGHRVDRAVNNHVTVCHSASACLRERYPTRVSDEISHEQDVELPGLRVQDVAGFGCQRGYAAVDDVAGGKPGGASVSKTDRKSTRLNSVT